MWHVVYSCSYHIRALAHPTLSDDGRRQDDRSWSRRRPPWLQQRPTAGHNGKKPRLTGSLGQNTLARAVCQAPRSFSVTDLRRSLHWLPVPIWLQDCHDYIQSQTDQHTSLHGIIDQWLHHIMNFTIIWQVTVVWTCRYSGIFSKGFCFWLT